MCKCRQFSALRFTFDALFPRGAYFGPKFALIGPANLLAVQPQFWFHPLQNVTGDLCWIWFWRESTNDALYSFENVQLRPVNLSNGLYIGSQPNLEIRWAISEHFLAALNLADGRPDAEAQHANPTLRPWQCRIGEDGLSADRDNQHVVYLQE
jgi:hypothetical protein